MQVVAQVDVLRSVGSGHWPAQSVTLTRTDRTRSDGMQLMIAELEAFVQWGLGFMEVLRLSGIGIGIQQAMPNVL